MKILQKIKLWLYSFRLNKSNPLGSVSIAPMPEIINEDTRTKDSIKRVIKAFEDQKVNMECMAKKQHSLDCQVIMCDKNPCLIREPDKKVGRVKKVPNKKSVALRDSVK